MSKRIVILTCEHATNFVPEKYHNLGLTVEELNTHIAYDKGCLELTKKLEKELDLSAFYGQVSRLVVDCNRRPEEDDCILAVSDNIKVPANADLSDADRIDRLDEFYYPYHQQISDKLNEVIANGDEPFLFSIHGYTPQLSDGIKRPWEAGLLYYQKTDDINMMLKVLDNTNMNIGRNEPYDMRKYDTGVCAIQATPLSISNALLEIRADEFDNMQAGVDKWSDILKKIINNI